ncbi:MAG: hypothetical protein F4112_11935 [Holophagales bacterium]|nr:hypothetical protein [Holophagales bacterium]MYD20770.1 hypothetical protein [Holophagales bacterium]MYI33663.1 hypothetical protein [Holophagales bacterium]
MKLGLLAVFLSGALFAPAVLRSEEPEDSFDQSWTEALRTMAEASAKKAAAHDQWKETGDLDAYTAAVAEFEETAQRLEPSKLDLWEARQRLVELIYESDDATVFELYLIAKDRERASIKAQKEIEELRARMDRTAQNRALRGVPLTPEN